MNRRITVLFAATALALAGCGSSPSPEPAAEPPVTSEMASASPASEKLSDEQACERYNKLWADLRKEHPLPTDGSEVTQTRPFAQEELLEIAQASEGSLSEDMRTIAETANEMWTVELNDVMTRLDEACGTLEYFEANGIPVPTEPEPEAATEPVVGSAEFHLKDRDGYEMSFGITWHEAQITPGSELDAVTSSECLKRFAISDPEAYTFNTIRIAVDVNRPEVNGFQWPEESIPRLYVSGNGYTCGAGIAEADNAPTVTAPGETVNVIATERTPNNPNGETESPSITVWVGGSPGSSIEECTVVGAEDIPEGLAETAKCEVAYPGA